MNSHLSNYETYEVLKNVSDAAGAFDYKANGIDEETARFLEEKSNNIKRIAREAISELDETRGDFNGNVN